MIQDWARATAPSIDDIEKLAATAWASVPAEFRALASDLVIRVDDLCEDETVLKDLGLESPFDLTGLYHGRDLARRSVADVPQGPDFVFLYRLPILAEWAETGVLLGDLVANVLIHEVAHHFGFSDDDIAALEFGPDGHGPGR